MTDPERKAVPAWAWIGLGIILLFAVWWRGHTIGPTVKAWTGLVLWPVVQGEAEPLDCDECAYAYIGHRILKGDTLYRDLTEYKPPLGYWIYAAAIAIGGYSELAIRVSPIPFVLATVGLVWWIGLRLRGPATGCLAALVFVFLSTDPYLFGNGSNFEHAINFFATASLAALVLRLGGGGRWSLLVAGTTLGAAALVKQVAVTHLLVYALAAWAMPRPQLDRRVRWATSVLLDLALLAFGFAAVWGLALLVIVLDEAGPAAFEDVVRYASALASRAPADPNAPPLLVRWFTGNADPQGVLPPPFGRTDYLVWWGSGSWPCWLAAIVSAGRNLVRGGSSPLRRLVALWTVSAWVQVLLPRLFWQHYYLLPTPGVALLTALATIDLACDVRKAWLGKQIFRSAFFSLLLAAFAIALVSTGIIQVRRYLLVPAEELTVRYKGGGQWVFLRVLGRDLGRRARETWSDPHLYVWGIQTPLLFYSGLDGVTPQIFVDNLLRVGDAHDPVVGPRLDRIMKDLREQRPELVFTGYVPFPELLEFLRSNYYRSHIEVRGQPLPRPANGLGLWVETERFGRFENAVEDASE